jgi:glutamate dehydrogenase/leucine dehydrogenase
VECDVFSPCALGAVLSGATIPELRCLAVCGSANNQLATVADGPRLAARGVLYAPDYVVNAGGVINIAEERHPSGAPYDRDRALARVAGIADTLRAVLDRAEADGTTPVEAAERRAEERMAAVAALSSIRTARPGGPTTA